MGRIYLPTLKESGKPSRIYWADYYVNGRRVRESTGTDRENEAKRFLKQREGRAAAGMPILPRADKVRYEEVAKDLRDHYQATGSRNLDEAEARLKHLDAFFAARRVTSIGSAEITAYVVRRQDEKAANGTINRELATLSRMLRLAYENNKLMRLPVFRRPKEAAPRQGFFETNEFLSVRKHLAPDLQVAVTIDFTYGWRTQSEVLPLERRQLDLEAETLRLDVGETKNEDGRLVYLTPELKALLTAQVERVRALERKTGRIIPYLFPHLKGRFKGQRRQDFRKAWQGACRKAKLPGKLRHDFRRTAVRNMVNRGVPERVAMTVTGHRTRSVFDRYHIVSPADLQDVAVKMSATADGHSGG